MTNFLPLLAQRRTSDIVSVAAASKMRPAER